MIVPEAYHVPFCATHAQTFFASELGVPLGRGPMCAHEICTPDRADPDGKKLDRPRAH